MKSSIIIIVLILVTWTGHKPIIANMNMGVVRVNEDNREEGGQTDRKWNIDRISRFLTHYYLLLFFVIHDASLRFCSFLSLQLFNLIDYA